MISLSTWIECYTLSFAVAFSRQREFRVAGSTPIWEHAVGSASFGNLNTRIVHQCCSRKAWQAVLTIKVLAVCWRGNWVQVCLNDLWFVEWRRNLIGNHWLLERHSLNDCSRRLRMSFSCYCWSVNVNSRLWLLLDLWLLWLYQWWRSLLELFCLLRGLLRLRWQLHWCLLCFFW